jgi:hypothetical protein
MRSRRHWENGIENETADFEVEVITMKSTVIESTTLAKVAYDADRAVLQLEFRDRAVYQYLGFLPRCMKLCCVVRPKGVYFNKVTQSQFPYALLPG